MSGLPLSLVALLAVRVGLEQVEAEGGRFLRGQRVGLLSHAASVTVDGRHAIAVLRARGVDLSRLFGPEHGLRGRAAAGEKLGDGQESGLPVVSLYGAKTRPAAEDLRDLDVLVVDLQDAGVRFYTYASTMLLCLDAAAEAGIELVILDRPNPLGGLLIEGPERDPSLPPSLVAMAPGPLVHGLTMGELARLVNRARPRPARLRVVPMKGWKRSMTWADTGRPWVAPSPNLRSAEAALAYPGTALLEATNVSEGRGTDAPFVRLGAPWLAAEALVRAVHAPGFRLHPTEFTPRASEAAPSPKYRDQPCRGLRVEVTDGRRVHPYALGITLLHALHKQGPPFQLTTLDRLLGTAAVREALEAGEGVEAILRRDAPAIERFRRERKAALLY